MTYQQFPVVGPFQGHVDNVPTPHNPPNSFDEIRNFLCRKGRFHTRPKLVDFGAPPDGAIVRYIKTYKDVENNYHTLALTTQTAYAITSGATYNALSLPGGIANLTGTALPYGVIISNGRVYFSNGSRVILYADGESSIKDSTSPGAARYLAISNQHLIAAFCTEPEPGVAGSIEYRTRVRWSKAGDPNDWTSFGSGFNDLIDVPDIITGIATLGRNVGIFRENGITLMGGTGNGASPFAFENMTSAPSGVGNRFPYSLAVFNDTAAFVASNDIYTVNAGLNLTPIGGKAKKKIFEQIGQSSGGPISAFIIPQLSPGIDYLSYWLNIPGLNTTWVYGYDEDNWQEFRAAGNILTFIGQAIVA